MFNAKEIQFDELCIRLYFKKIYGTYPFPKHKHHVLENYDPFINYVYNKMKLVEDNIDEILFKKGFVINDIR